MHTFPLKSDAVSLSVTETGAQLSDVIFTLPDGRQVAPMHTAPWTDEMLEPDIPPMLRVLRGDFLCAPFGANDVVAGQDHGQTANGTWRLASHDGRIVDATLDGEVMGARVDLHVEVRPGQPAIYQRHTFTGGEGRLPVGHHAMLKAGKPLTLAFSPWTWAATPPDPIEVPPAGRSLLAYPQEIRDLSAARLAEGGTADLTVYPFAASHEDLWMLASSPKVPFAWSAATCPESGWVWFSLKDPRILPCTILWLSNGGRAYAPFSSRHRGVIGIEEVCSYFHLGHAASIADNPLSARGVLTAIALRPKSYVTFSYAFGLAQAPVGFGAVAAIHPAEGGIVLSDRAGRETFAACDPSFVTPPSLG